MQIIELVMDAIIKDNDGIMRELADRNLINDDFRIGRSKRSIIHLTASFGAVSCLRQLAKKYAAPPLPQSSSLSPLSLSLSLSFFLFFWVQPADTLLFLFCLVTQQTRGFDVNVTDIGKVTPLHLAAMNGHKACIKALVVDFGAGE